MDRITLLLDRVMYPHYGDDWDDVLFRDCVLRYLSRDKKVLDLGSGAGIVSQMNFKGMTGLVCGVDPDKRVLNNAYLDEAKIGSAESIPYKDRMFDVVICNNVFEHLDNPAAVFGEVHRVLRIGGFFLMKTPNRFHYVPTLSRLTPHRFHKFYNRLRGIREIDTFPTVYRANSCKAITRCARQAGFAIEKIELIEGRPEYLRINCLMYLFGILYERIVNTSDIFRNLRVLLIASLRKT